MLAALTALAFASTWTPGPNNAMLAASGATFGLRATQAHAWGVALGFPVMMFVIALGLGEAFRHSAVLGEALRWVGAALLIWIAWKIARAGRADGSATMQPFTFAQAAAFQWVNPKAWVMALSTAGAFTTGTAPLREAAVCACVFVLAGVTSSQAWTGLGAALRSWLARGWRLQVFNGAMAMLIALSGVYLLQADL